MEVKGMRGGEEKHGDEGWTRSPATTPMLSPENWDRILTKLPLEDFRSAMNTCPEWNKLMTPKKNLILFTKVLPMLAKYLPVETIFECRQVSEDVKNVAHQLLTNPSDCGPFPPTLSWEWKLSNAYVLTDHSKIAKFMSLMKSRPFPEESPFIGGSASINRLLFARTEQLSEQRVEAVKQVLSRYGHHVRKMKIVEPFLLRRGHIDLYASLLAYLPNLESLEISCNLYSSSDQDMRHANLPKLDKLEELRFADINEYPTPFIFRFLEQYGHQLKTLSIVGLVLEAEDYWDWIEDFVPNLKRLEVDDFGYSYWMLNTLATTSKLALEELCIEAYHSSVWELLAAVNNFAGTLVILGMSWARSDCVKVGDLNCVREMIPLPKLTTLTIPLDPKMDWILEFLELQTTEGDLFERIL